MHHDHLFAKLGDDTEVMGDEQDRRAGMALQVPDQPQDLLLHGDIERRGRLVRNDQLRLARKGDGDQDALALPPDSSCG